MSNDYDAAVAALTAEQTSIETLEDYHPFSAAAWAACETVEREVER